VPPFAPLICYEIIFPGRAALKHDRPGWLVNLTNDAWFGTSTGPYQHLHFARVRAVEEGLPVVRAANTGISTVIDAYGQIRSKLDLNQTGVIDEGLPKAIAPTLFSRISSGLLILLILFPPLIYFAMVSRQGRG
jgi:apolipoprotein N-acyltransferase